MYRFFCMGGVLLLSFGCRNEGVELNISHVQSDDLEIGAALSASGPKGNPLPMNNNNTGVYVETAQSGGSYEPATNVEVYFSCNSLVDAVVIADNSGSEADYIDDIQAAVTGFSDVILSRKQPDRVGLVRVSTTATVMSELSMDLSDLEAHIDGMFVNEGWTALWDGVRLGNDVLENGAVLSSGNDICIDPSYRSMVVFTDGQDNNSSNEEYVSDDVGDIDTVIDDLFDLSIHDQNTAVYTIGVGNNVDESALMLLSQETGGSYRHIDNYGGLAGALRAMGNALTQQVPVCFTRSSCDHDTARIQFDYLYQGNWVSRTFDVSLPSCAP